MPVAMPPLPGMPNTLDFNFDDLQFGNVKIQGDKISTVPDIVPPPPVPAPVVEQKQSLPEPPARQPQQQTKQFESAESAKQDFLNGDSHKKPEQYTKRGINPQNDQQQN